MALSAILFYTNKVYPKDIVLDKNTIPDDPNERLKDKVFMSVVFTVKHFCEYKDFVVPETTFKDDLKCTKEQMEKILKSLSNKFNVTFDKHWFGTVGDLTIYVKDHRTAKKSEETLSEATFEMLLEGILFGVGAATAVAIIALIGSLTNKLSKSQSSSESDSETDKEVWLKIKPEYAKLCGFILKYGKDDPFLSKEKHNIYTLDECMKIGTLFKKRWEDGLTLPKRTETESNSAYTDRLLDVMQRIKYDNDFSKRIPKASDRTYMEAQYFDINKVDKTVSLWNDLQELSRKLDHHIDECRNSDPSDTMDGVNVLDLYEEYSKYTDCSMDPFLRQHMSKILKYTKDRLEQAKKQSK